MTVCSNDPGHMTKMAAMSIYGKTPSKIQNQRALGLGMQHWGLGPNKFVQMMTLGWPSPFLLQGQICFLILLYRKIYISPGKMLESLSHLMEETHNKWPEWQKVYVDIKILSPGGCLPLPQGYIHLLNNEKMCIKSGWSDEAFLLTSKFWAKWFVCSCWGYIDV